MEQQKYSSETNKIQKKNAPVPVLILGILMGLGGITQILTGFVVSLISLSIGVISIGLGIGLVVVAIGIRKMRKWALYAFTVIAVLGGIGAGISLMSVPNTVLLGVAAIQFVLLVYFWSIRRQFV